VGHLGLVPVIILLIFPLTHTIAFLLGFIFATGAGAGFVGAAATFS
jgi:hypothetical protein